MVNIHSIDTIVSDDTIHDGQPIIAGTRLRVSDLAASHIYRGLSPEELASNFALDMGQVHAALAYYFQHKAEIDEQMRLDTEDAEKLLAEFEAQGKLIQI